MNEILNEQRRLRLLEKGVELLTFSQYWYNDETFTRHFKAWSSDGAEIKLDQWPEADLYFHLKDLGIHDWYKVFGWQVRNGFIQIAAQDLEYIGGDSKSWDLLEGEEWQAYQHAAKHWVENHTVFSLIPSRLTFSRCSKLRIGHRAIRMRLSGLICTCHTTMNLFVLHWQRTPIFPKVRWYNSAMTIHHLSVTVFA
jgi:hypothetical protein